MNFYDRFSSTSENCALKKNILCLPNWVKDKCMRVFAFKKVIFQKNVLWKINKTFFSLFLGKETHKTLVGSCIKP